MFYKYGKIAKLLYRLYKAIKLGLIRKTTKGNLLLCQNILGEKVNQ